MKIKAKLFMEILKYAQKGIHVDEIMNKTENTHEDLTNCIRSLAPYINFLLKDGYESIDLEGSDFNRSGTNEDTQEALFKDTTNEDIKAIAEGIAIRIAADIMKSALGTSFLKEEDNDNEYNCDHDYLGHCDNCQHNCDCEDEEDGSCKGDCDNCNYDCEFKDKDVEEDEENGDCHEVTIHIIEKGHADDYVGFCPILFTGTTDFEFGAGIGKYYVDKYLPLWRSYKPDIPKYSNGKQSIGVAHVENEMANAEFYILMPKRNRYEKISDEILRETFRLLAAKLKEDDVSEIAMPPIFCGHEGKDFDEITIMMVETFCQEGVLIDWAEDEVEE